MQSNALWPTTTRFPSLEHDIAVDIAIIGGGIAGISSAYQLQKAGYTVIVLERDEVGSSATGASSGVLYYGSGTNFAPAVKLFGESRAKMLWNETASTIGDLVSSAKKFKIDCGLRECGAIMVAKNNGEEDQLIKERELLGKIGIHTKILPGADIKTYFPIREFASGLTFDACAQIHPARFISGLAKSTGLRIHENSQVKTWEAKGDKVILSTPKCKVTASKVIFATNQKPLFGLEAHFNLESSVIIASKKLDDINRIWQREKIFWTMEEKYDLIYPRDGRAILELYSLNGMNSKLAYYYPGIDFDSNKQWGDVWAKTDDWLPIVGEVDKNIYAAIAMGDQGIVMGWTAGKHILNMLEGKKDMFLDMVSPRRFIKR